MNELINDTYKSINTAPNQVLFKDKNSKFYGFAFPVTNEIEVKDILLDLRKKHSQAQHFCYAYQIGVEQKVSKTNDDGEPSYSAGMPIFSQIQSFEITNVLVVVVRYFGGIKLGVGGLINAYKTTAHLVLKEAPIEEKIIYDFYVISFSYKNMNKVMRIIKEKKLQIVSQKIDLNCEIELAIRKKNTKLIPIFFSEIYEIDIKKKDLLKIY